MNSSADGSSRSRSLVGMPRTRLGWSSIGLATGFLGLLVAWMFYVTSTPMDRPTFFSDPVHAVILIGAAAAAVTGGVVGALAVVANRERSLTILLSVLVGAFVLWWTVSGIVGQ